MSVDTKKAPCENTEQENGGQLNYILPSTESSSGNVVLLRRAATDLKIKRKSLHKHRRFLEMVLDDTIDVDPGYAEHEVEKAEAEHLESLASLRKIKASFADQWTAQVEAVKHRRWLAALTPADVPSVATDDLFSLAPDLLTHVTVEQAQRISVDRRKDFTPEQAEALAGRFAEVDELRRQRERERFQAKQREREAQAEAEYDALLEELGIVPIAEDMDGEEDQGAATPMLFDGWIPDDRPTLLHGPKEGGKTTVLAGMAMSLSGGVAIFPSLVPSYNRPVNGIVVLAEDTRAQFNAILRAYSDLAGVQRVGQILPWETEGPLMVNNGCGWEASEMLEQLEDLICRSRARYVILDHLGLLAGDMSTDSKDDMTDLFRKLTRISKDLEVAILLATHSKDGGTDPAGTVYLRNLPRCVLRISSNTKGTQLHQQYFNYADKMPPIKLQRVGAAFVEVTSQDATAATEEAQDQKPADNPCPLLVEWMTDHPEAKIPLAALLQGKGGDAEAMLDHLRGQIPGLRNGEAHAAAQCCIDAGTLVLAEAKINRKTRMVLAVP